MKVVVKSEEELMELGSELLHILVNLRFATKAWERDYGANLRGRKKYYELKADELIQKLQLTKSHHSYQIKIDINAEENTTQES